MSEAKQYQRLGIQFYKEQNYLEAVEYFNIAIILNPNDEITHCIKGAALNELGKYVEAIQSYDTSLKLNPNDAHVHSIKGVALYKLGKYVEAIQSYDLALKLNPNYALAHFNKGNALNQLEKYVILILIFFSFFTLSVFFIKFLFNIKKDIFDQSQVYQKIQFLI